MEQPLEAIVGHILNRRGWTLAVAESCTGGLLGSRITNVPGASSYFLGGVVAYANQIKADALGVQSDTLRTLGAVSQETALEMARGICRLWRADVGVSITGIAGPEGGTPEKPVGRTWIAVHTPEVEKAIMHDFQGDRISNKVQATEAALRFLQEVLLPDITPISVEARWDREGNLQPMAFEIDDVRHSIASYGRHWMEGNQQHFLVMTPTNQTFELAYDDQTASWRLIRSPDRFRPRKPQV